MVIEHGHYAEFKRCAFRLLDYGRVASAVETLYNWSLIAQPQFELSSEQFESSSVILKFNFTFEQDYDYYEALLTMIGRAVSIDGLLREVWMDGKSIFYNLHGTNGVSLRPFAHRGKRGKVGAVAFLLHVPYPCEAPDEPARTRRADERRG